MLPRVSAGFYYFLGQVFVFSVLIVVTYWIWHPLGAAAIVFTAGCSAALLMRTAIRTGPLTISELSKPSLVVIGGLWGAFVGALVRGLTFRMMIPLWAGIPFYVLGWAAVGYPGWAELPGLARYRDSMIEEAALARGENQARECSDRAIQVNNLFDNIRFFRRISMASYIGVAILVPALRRFL